MPPPPPPPSTPPILLTILHRSTLCSRGVATNKANSDTATNKAHNPIATLCSLCLPSRPRASEAPRVDVPRIDTRVGEHTDLLAFEELVVLLGPRLVCTHTQESVHLPALQARAATRRPASKTVPATRVAGHVQARCLSQHGGISGAESRGGKRGEWGGRTLEVRVPPEQILHRDPVPTCDMRQVVVAQVP